MRVYYVICSIITSIANILLILLFRPLRSRLNGTAWLCIIIGYFLVLINNLIISFLVIERPRASIVAILLIIFFAIKPIKNTLWLVGFWTQYKNFIMLENIEKSLPKYVSSDTNKIIKKENPVASELVEDLEGNENKSRGN